MLVAVVFVNYINQQPEYNGVLSQGSNDYFDEIREMFDHMFVNLLQCKYHFK